MTDNHRAALFATAESLTLRAAGIATLGYMWQGDALVLATPADDVQAEIAAADAWDDAMHAQYMG
jgi:hypothetical protein